MAEEHQSFKDRFKCQLIFTALWLIATAICATVRIRTEGFEKLEKIVKDGKGGLVLPWHGVTILPIYYCRNMGFYSIVSVSKDGELQNKMLRSRGFKTIRGSSGRHGMRALLESIRSIMGGAVMAITPDGTPPQRKVQAGTVYLAKKSGCPVLPVGVACSPCKRVHSWDRHMIPLPFSKAIIAFGDPLYIDTSEDDNKAAARVEDAINAAEHRAHEIMGIDLPDFLIS